MTVVWSTTGQPGSLVTAIDVRTGEKWIVAARTDNVAATEFACRLGLGE